MKINEIEKLKAFDYTGWETLKDANIEYGTLNTFKKLPKTDGLYYTTATDNFSKLILIAVPVAKKIYPSQQWDIVGYLNLSSSGIWLPAANVYKKMIYSVNSIAVNKQFRSLGIASKLYNLAIIKNVILFAGDSQTPGGRAMWFNLSNKPGIEVTGWVSFYKDPNTYKWGPQYDFDDFIKFIEKQGGSYLGESKEKIYFEFAVAQMPSKKELEILSKKGPIKVYHAEYSTGKHTGLMAKMV